MSNREDPLNRYENLPPNVQGDYLIRRERGVVRNFIPPNHPDSQTGMDFARGMADDGAQHPVSYTDNLPPVHVLLRGMEEQNTPENRRTIGHELQSEKNEIRRRMNTELLAKKIEYEDLATKRKGAPSHLDRNRSIIEDKIRRKSVALNNDYNDYNGNDDYNGNGGGGTLAQPYPEITSVGVSENDTIEGFTSPGAILGQQEDLLYSNKFDSTRVLKQDLSREFKQNFRRYYEDKRALEEKLDKVPASNSDPIKTNNFNFALGSEKGSNPISQPGGFGVMPKGSVGNQLTDPHEMDRYNKPRVTLVSIDSSDRDKIRYPDANSFKISLGRQFRNVKRVVLVSTEFPNTDIIIREDPREAAFERNRILLKCGEVLNDANNHLYWINAEDAVSLDGTASGEPAFSCVVYDAEIDPGNYKAISCQCDEETLGQAIEEKVNNINHFKDGTRHQFIVTIDPQTNIVRFLSIESANLAVNPITTSAGTNVIVVSQPGHPFSAGDIVTITGSDAVGGITSTTINGEHPIESVTIDTYTIRVTQIATSTETGGGANVLSGENKPMKLLFSNIDTIGQILGFPQQDSSEQIANKIEFIDIDPDDLSTTPVTTNPGMPGTVPARIKSTNHGLVPGDEILIIDTDTIPNINGIQVVTEVITDDEFEIGIPIKVVNNQTVTDNTTVGTVCLSLDTSLTEVTSLSTVLVGNIQTTIPHNFDEGDFVFIGNVVGGLTLAAEPINGIQTVSANLSPTCFDITAGISFEGFDISNAFVFQTTSTEVKPITALIPMNNGVIEPTATEPVFVGTDQPNFVFFRNMGVVVPDLNGEVTGIYEVSYYSESTGRFDLTTPITSISSQTASQQYIRSSDASLRSITDAFIQSNGTFRLSVPHDLMSGNRIYVRSLIPDLTTSLPRINPDITGIITVNTILNDQNFDTTTEIISSTFDTGDIAYIQTEDKTTTRIQNIYPYSNNYLAKDIDTCRFPNCVMCENSQILIKDSYLRVASTSDPLAAIAEETSATELLNGTRTTNHVYSGQSQNFTHIFDLQDVILDVLPLPVRRVTAPLGFAVQHTITLFSDFPTIMLDDPTTGTVIFGGAPQVALQIDTPYTFSYSPSTAAANFVGVPDSLAFHKIQITTLLDTTFAGSLDSGDMAAGTMYIKYIEFDSQTSYRSPLGNCFITQTGGVAPGTNGTPANATFQEIGGGVIEVTTSFAHGLVTGDIIYIASELIDPPPDPSTSNPWYITAWNLSVSNPVFTVDFPGHNVNIVARNFPVAVNTSPFRPRATINGNLTGINIFTSGTGNTNVYQADVPSGTPYPPDYVFGTNTIGLLDIPTTRTIGAFAPNRAGITFLDVNPGGSGGQGRFFWTFTEKDDNFLATTTQVVNATSTNTFEITLSGLSGSGYTGIITYITVCGDEVPILSYFGNSWSGLFESQRHLLSSSVTSNIYIGKALEAGTTPLPIDMFAVPDSINGYLGNTIGTLTDAHPFESPLNYHFFTSFDLFDHPIVQEELETTAAEFVNVSGNSEIFSELLEITPANAGLIESALPHGFMGGERLYFLGNVEINNGVANDLRNSFFEVASVDPTDNRRFTINVPLTVIGNGNVGNFFQVPPNETPHFILNINRQTNGVFFTEPDHGLNLLIPKQIFITNNSLPPTDDVFGNALAFRYPAPLRSAERFDTAEIIVKAEDLGVALANNKVDIVSTSNALFPELEGMSWVYAPITQKIPIDNIYRDSSGTLSPVSADLAVGDMIYMKSLQSTTQDLNGFFTVSYIDLISSSFFELEGTVITDVGGTIDSGNIVYFRVPNANACVTINDITEGQCPTTIRATDHGYTSGSIISVFICGTETDHSIEYTDVGIINDVLVKDDDELILPLFNNGDPTANLCVDTVFNGTNLFIEQKGKFSKQILSTNCGDALLTPDPINHQTIVTTDNRKNIKTKLMFSIISSTPASGGSSQILIQLSQGYTSIPWKNGDLVQISGHIGGNPYIDGEYKVFDVKTDTFRILTRPGTTFLSTGGTGGFVTGPAPLTVPGHGLFTNDKIIFEDMKTVPPLNGEIFDVTVTSANTFTIPVVVEQFNNRCPGFWCSNVIDMEIRDHGLIDGDTFFLYNTQSVGGIQPAQLDTTHGDKRMNIATTEEIVTQKTVRVIDGNNIQFIVNSFPSARTIGGGFIVCISSNNHNQDELDMGLKNYGFNAIQTNQDCLGKAARFIDLNNESYVLMVSEALNHMLNTSTVVNKIFAKIQLNVAPGQVAFNSFVTTERIFDTPITRLDEIDLQIRRSDGKLFDLRGRDYSMSLLIEEYQDRLRNAEISSRRGVPDRGLVSQAGFIESTISAENPQQNILNPAQFLATTDLTQRAKVATGFNS